VNRDVAAGGLVSSRELRSFEVGELAPLGSYLATNPDAMKRLVALDERTMAELGQDFSDEVWTENNFAYPLPGKFDMSFVATLDGELVGFWIGSERVRGEAHAHRAAVEARWRTGAIALCFWSAFWRAAAARGGIRKLTSEMSPANARMRAFHELCGYRVLDPDETRAYLAARGREECTHGSEIIGSGGARSIAMTRPLC
jgi:RimJ/RimL family protein N-acetyltransferase